MYCPKCGTENPDGTQLCRSCSWVLTSTPTQAPSLESKTSGLAITSFVLGILTFFTLGITAIPAIILGIMALVKIRKNAGQLKGKGLAIAGIAVTAALLLIIVSTILSALFRVKPIAQRMNCGSNISSLGKVMIVYCSDNNGMYPTPSKWCDLLLEHADATKYQFRCPGASKGPCNYAMN